MSITLRRHDRDTRWVEINGRRFEVITNRNTRGNITGWGIFERWPQPRPDGPYLTYGEWWIDPTMASFGECRAWLEAFARGEHPPRVSGTVF